MNRKKSQVALLDSAATTLLSFSKLAIAALIAVALDILQNLKRPLGDVLRSHKDAYLKDFQNNAVG